MSRSFVHCITSAALLLCLIGIAGAAADEVEVNGARLEYVEQGSGEPVVLVHGAVSDLRVWEPVRNALAKDHRVITYTQRYFGTGPWPDEGKGFSMATHADDLAAFISSLDTGPVHLVGWSYGAAVATIAAVNNPQLVQSLVLYEPSLGTVLSPESAEAKRAAAERAQMFGPALAANKAGDAKGAAFRLIEGVFLLAEGEAARQPERWQEMWRDNARTIPVMFSALPPPAVSCDTLAGFTKPALLVLGEGTKSFFPVIAERISQCIPGAEQVVLAGVNHDAPVRDPAGFSNAVREFVSKH